MSACQSISVCATSLSSWRSIVRDTLNDLHCCRPGGGSFTGSLSSRDLLETRFVRIAADDHQASIDSNRISRSDRDHVLLSVLEEGEAKIFQGGHEATLLPGDIAIYDTGKPYQFVVNRPFVQTVLRLHRDDLAQRIPNVHDFTARRIAGNRGAGRIASSHIREVYRQLDHISPATARSVQRNLLDVVACALSDPEPASSSSFREHQHLLLQRIMGFVEEKLFDDELSCEGVAHAIGISERYLRKLCSVSGCSLSERILKRRLEEASRRLSNANAVRVPITSVAYDCGFKDAAHFSRAFKTKFGMTPREYRNCSVYLPHQWHDGQEREHRPGVA